MFFITGVLGCVDGTHIPISKPFGDDYEEYRCRKGFFSINVQAVCTADLRFSNIVARWKGATHDSRIWMNSSLFARFERQELSGHLLGDSGYACSDFLLTPVRNPYTESERRYNRSHIRTRNSVERMFGVWKSRFQCLRNTLRFQPRNSCNVIIACAVLHNFCKQQNEPDPTCDEEPSPDYEDESSRVTTGRTNYRRQIIERFFQ